MAIKIKEIFGYKLGYDEGLKRFVVEDMDDTELAWGTTQDEAEAKAKALSKQEFNRIRIVRVEQDGQVTMGELTSLNRDDRSAWVFMEKSKGGFGSGRKKLDFNYSRGFYAATEENLKISESIKAKGVILAQIKEEIGILIKTLEKPINLDYFGIPR